MRKEINIPDHYIAGGLNDIDGIHNYRDWNRLQAYRRALYGEVYERFPEPDENGRKGHFVKKYEPTCVTLESLLLKGSDDENYYQYVAVPSMASVAIQKCTIKDGFIRTADGRYVLTWNKDYNNKVLGQFVGDSNYGYFRRNFQWRNFGRGHGKGFVNFTKYKGIYTGQNDYDYFYQYGYAYSYDRQKSYQRAYAPKRVRRLNTGMIIPIGGDYKKFSFYAR